MSDLILIRGLPGSGKSTLAKALTLTGFEHVEADMYFETPKGYMFDREKLKAAHEWCLLTASMHMALRRRVVVANTFSRKWEMQPYIDLGFRLNYAVRIITTKGSFTNVHGVPEEVIQAMQDRWENF